jgi:hypothetical protein
MDSSEGVLVRDTPQREIHTGYIDERSVRQGRRSDEHVFDTLFGQRTSYPLTTSPIGFISDLAVMSTEGSVIRQEISAFINIRWMREK